MFQLGMSVLKLGDAWKGTQETAGKGLFTFHSSWAWVCLGCVALCQRAPHALAAALAYVLLLHLRCQQSWQQMKSPAEECETSKCKCLRPKVLQCRQLYTRLRLQLQLCQALHHRTTGRMGRKRTHRLRACHEHKDTPLLVRIREALGLVSQSLPIQEPCARSPFLKKEGGASLFTGRKRRGEGGGNIIIEKGRQALLPLLLFMSVIIIITKRIGEGGGGRKGTRRGGRS